MVCSHSWPEPWRLALRSCSGNMRCHCQTLWGVSTLRRARQMALLHLKPEPKAICHTRSPRRTPAFVSMLASTYLRAQRALSPFLSSSNFFQMDARLCNFR